MFKKILIANRGEIASRIIRTCRKMGIYTIAVYSEADMHAPHVHEADEAHHIGNAPVKDSYLKVDKIIEVGIQSGADAVHPGYGLLSENAVFARKCADSGITFIGPSPEILEKMGNKIEARKSMLNAGVPVIPGVNFSIKNVTEAISVAHEIGYPIMLKASAGGGGIGIDVVRNDDELRKKFESNQNRALNYFGDQSIYIEKYIEYPRHIEIQILADNKGNTVYLGERECSIQRRHQKVVEEAPSPFLDKSTRLKMGSTAVQAAKHLGYVNAGTVEFLVDKNQQFYFLEMNTRLQVEHPVTEEITGIDLVEEQIRISQGESLGYTQHDIGLKGHAIEVRIYAEDPKTFFPSPGTIQEISIPTGDNIRHELAVKEKFTVSTYYDPMIAKLIVKGENRHQAIEGMKKALEKYKVRGIKTNIPILKQVISHDAFISGNTTTYFVEQYLK